jgi:alpha-1,6-mannosyltransferase
MWYFYSALPRALGATLPLIPVGAVLNRRVSVAIFPALFFVFLFSFLPHKELRFIFPAIPLLNVGAAVGADVVWKSRGKNFYRALVAVGVMTLVLFNAVFSTALLIVSSKNYPGGSALYKMHQLEECLSDGKVEVHIDVFSAQTGVSR